MFVNTRCLQLLLCTSFLSGGSVLPADIPGRYTGDPANYTAAVDSTRVTRSGSWQESSFRYGAIRHLQTSVDGATLEYTFRGTGIILLLENHSTAEYSEPNLGRLDIAVDGAGKRVIYPQRSPLEVTVARDLTPGVHCLKLVHRTAHGGGTGCRIIGFRALDAPSGDLVFTLGGEENQFLVNARALLRRQGKLVRSTLVRNRLTGRCSVAGIPAGESYELEVGAMGWDPVKLSGIKVVNGETMVLEPLYLQRNNRARNRRYTRMPIHWPRLGHPVVRKPDESFRVRVSCHLNELEGVILRRVEGPAVISRRLEFKEHRELAFYYEHEMTAHLPENMPLGLYDLVVRIRKKRNGEILSTIAPQSVYIVKEYPRDPVFFTFGHLDTSGQYQAEYLKRMADMANLVAPDMLLISNEVNPAYVSGALRWLRMPYVINFGNHQVPGNYYWYGDPVDVVDYGNRLTVLNFGLQWHDNLAKARALLAERRETSIKVINAYEQNAPVEEFLDRFGVAMLHDGHGTGKKVMEMGATPTIRVGKVNAYSFRIIRFAHAKVATSTYGGDEVAPYPFPREKRAPLRVTHQPANDGNHRTVTAIVTNDLKENIPRGRVTFVLPWGDYSVTDGEIESVCGSDDGRYTVLDVRTDLPAASQKKIVVKPVR